MTHTVNQAAAEFKRTTARIRQICIKHKIGRLVAGRVRLLSPAQMQKIGAIIAENGHHRDS